MYEENSIKQAFQKVKEDVLSLGHELSNIQLDILELRKDISQIKQELDRFLAEKLRQEAEKNLIQIPQITEKPLNLTPTHPQTTPTLQQITPTHPRTPTDDLPLKDLIRQYTPLSTGNGGVPTDRQTNRQTDKHIFQHINVEPNKPESSTLPTTTTPENHLNKATEILESLDNIKKDLRLKIKRLTPQEMKIFSIIYQLDVEKTPVDYKLLSEKTNLSQSSIRDYILKITAKGILIDKEKLNNKRILLHISENLTKIASLETILKLREI